MINYCARIKLFGLEKILMVFQAKKDKFMTNVV
jgi:hypothetical protein